MAANMVVLEGKLIRLEATTTKTGKHLANFELAFRNNSKDNPETYYIQCTMWTPPQPIIDDLNATPNKAMVRVTGALRQEKWTDKEGKNRSTIKLVVDSIAIMRVFKDDEDAPEQRQPAYAKPAVQVARQTVPASKASPVEDSIENDNIPF